MELKINSEYEALLPRLSKEEYEALKTSMQLEGQHFPIVVNEDKYILDGHHRYRACSELGVTPKIEVKSFSDKLLEKKFVIEANLRRRHLNDFQKAELAMPLLDIEGELAKQRQEKGGLASIDAKGKAVEKTAKKIGMSTKTFERAKKVIEKGTEKQKEKLRQGKTSIHYAYKQVMKRERPSSTPPLPQGVYDVVYADPPWEYYLNLRGSPDSHYATMSMDALCNLKFPFAEDAVLFLWTTNAQLENAFLLLKAWGFSYKSHLVWIKNKFGTGSYFRGQHELLLLAIKGKISCPLEENRPSSVFLADVEEHSKKPNQVRRIIQKMYPNRKYLELFAREKAEGWEAWGNEVNVIGNRT